MVFVLFYQGTLCTLFTVKTGLPGCSGRHLTEVAEDITMSFWVGSSVSKVKENIKILPIKGL